MICSKIGSDTFVRIFYITKCSVLNRAYIFLLLTKSYLSYAKISNFGISTVKTEKLELNKQNTL